MVQESGTYLLYMYRPSYSQFSVKIQSIDRSKNLTPKVKVVSTKHQFDILTYTIILKLKQVKLNLEPEYITVESPQRVPHLGKPISHKQENLCNLLTVDNVYRQYMYTISFIMW